MEPIGKIPSNLEASRILTAIGENIIIADTEYNILWLNPAAVKLLSQLIVPYGVARVEDLIGMNMNAFHRKPDRQQRVMATLTESHRARITIKDKVVTDIVIDPVWNKQGEIACYIVMLMDVTSKAMEEERKAQLIDELSFPLLKIWDNALALPLVGTLDMDRFNLILTKLLKECKEHRAFYVVVDLSGLNDWHSQISYQLERMISGLELMGTTCLIAGVKPELAQQLQYFAGKVPVFSSTKAATKYIISK